jgi:hypothetical protein
VILHPHCLLTKIEHSSRSIIRQGRYLSPKGRIFSWPCLLAIQGLPIPMVSVFMHTRASLTVWQIFDGRQDIHTQYCLSRIISEAITTCLHSKQLYHTLWHWQYCLSSLLVLRKIKTWIQCLLSVLQILLLSLFPLQNSPRALGDTSQYACARGVSRCK